MSIAVLVFIEVGIGNENTADDRKEENLFLFEANLHTILLTRKLKNYRVLNLLVYFKISWLSAKSK